MGIFADFLASRSLKTVEDKRARLELSRFLDNDPGAPAGFSGRTGWAILKVIGASSLSTPPFVGESPALLPNFLPVTRDPSSLPLGPGTLRIIANQIEIDEGTLGLEDDILVHLGLCFPKPDEICLITNSLLEDRAIRVDKGNNSHLNDTADFRPSDTVGSMSFWIKGTDPASNDIQAIFIKHVSSADLLYFQMRNTTNFLRILSRVDSNLVIVEEATIDLIDGAFHHVVITTDGPTWVVYIDGSLKTLDVISGSNRGDWFGDIVGGDNLHVGKSHIGEPGDFTIDEMGFWNIQLTSGNVTTLYNGGNGILFNAANVIPGLVHYWSFSANHDSFLADRVGGLTWTNVNVVTDDEGIPAGAV